jgi:hypothetical protein
MVDKTKKASKGEAGKGEKAKGKKAKQAAPDTKPETTVAGIIEELREAGARLVAVANTPAGREVIAVGISMAAAAAQAALAAKRAKAKPDAAKAEPDAAAGKKPGRSAGEDALAAALGGVAEMALAKVFPKKG